MRALALGLILCGGLFGQAIVNTSGSAGGGGATTIAELTDVDETSRTEDDILKVNAGGDYVNTNILAAIGEEFSNERVLFTLGGELTTDIDLQFDGQYLSIGGTAGGMSSSYQLAFGTSGSKAGIYGEQSGGGSSLRFTTNNGVQKFQIGGSQTALIKDTTPTTGITTDRCEDGANQGVTACRQTESFNSFDGVAFSELSSHANGTYAYCTDCTKATPCASGGSGAFAKKINGAWDCD